MTSVEYHIYNAPDTNRKDSRTSPEVERFHSMAWRKLFPVNIKTRKIIDKVFKGNSYFFIVVTYISEIRFS